VLRSVLHSADGRTRLVRVPLVLAALALGLSACGGSSQASSDEAASGGVHSVTHESGTTDDVPDNPQRIVSVSVTMTGHLLALDAPVVGSQVMPGPFTDDTGFFVQWADKATEEGIEPVYANTDVDLEAITALEPDLIIGAAAGGDAAGEYYDQLSQIAPTLIYRYDNISWEDLTTKLGEDLNLQDQAESVLADYQSTVQEVTDAIEVPDEDVVPLRVNGDQLAVFTSDSAQGQLLAEVGLSVHDIPEDLLTTSAQSAEGGGSDRSDVVAISAENLGPALDDSSVFFVGHTQEQIDTVESGALWKVLPAVEQARAYDLGLDSFRLDYFSATDALEQVKTALAA